MLKTILTALVSLFLVSNSADKSPRPQQISPDTQTGTLEKMIVANGSVALDVDLNQLSRARSHSSSSQLSTLRFDAAANSFFTIIVFNNDLRGLEPGSMALVPQTGANLPAGIPVGLNASYRQLKIESTSWGEPFELVVRDQKTGFVFFNIEGHQYDYAADQHVLGINNGRLLLSKEFAAVIGRPAEAGAVVGKIAITANMRPIEITQVVNGEATSSVMPPSGVLAGTVPGPDVIVGDLSGLAQFGSSSGTQVGLAVGTDSCNAGVVPLNWLALPNNDHPVIPQNLYRMSGGGSNNDRFEQIGQSNVKHAFTALQQNICGFGCVATGSTTLGSGCSDPYSASLNAGNNNALGSRAWINPFTGAYPRGDSGTPPNTHTGHSHTGPSHRILVEMSDLNTTLNPGATYFAEAQYVTPHEYAWCIAHPGECNMGNNASYRQYTVSGTTSFTFAAAGTTQRMKPAITAWTGATTKEFQPDPGNDGVAYVGYKVTNPSPGVWHYEYILYNQNLDRAIQSFSVPVGSGTVSNLGFHAPPQHPGWTQDGTVGNAGYSSAPWTPTQTANSVTWNSETFVQNPNANAIRWGTLYNFRFDSNRPPATTSATVGFFKTGAPILVSIQAPDQGPGISISDVVLTEGNSGTKLATFTASLSSASTDTVTVQYATADDTATAGSDYVAASGTVTFNPSVVSQPISITINGDTLEEFNETFFVNLSVPTNGTIADAQGVGTLTNDEAPLANLPVGFAETQINGLSNPTAMAIHPDGRVFVCQQSGALRVIKNGALLATPFTTLTVNSSGERGLLGIAFDPNYASNRFVYVYYTATTPSIHNRVSRFTADIANQDVAVVGSELPILDLENLSATNHNGGAIHFGPDGKLYVAVGENANSGNSQVLTNRLGKMLRINSDGTIPPDNPTTFPGIVGSPAGLNQAIWAVGLRNPFTFNFQPGTGRMHINDVGQSAWEEINLGVAGANYGWGAGCEGACGVAGMTNPIYQYANDASTCAIAGGAFYNPTTPTFPSEYLGKYFLADLCGGWMKTIDPVNPPATGAAASFATGISSPVDIQVANDGSLYYLARGTSSVFRVQYFGSSTLTINDVTVTEGNAGTSTANFTVTLSPASTQTVTVQYTTADVTATAGSDYVSTTNSLTFTPGQTSKPVSVTINGDTTFEANETFNVNLSSPTNATLADGQGVGTITNDDAQPTVQFLSNVTHSEAGTGSITDYDFTVTLSNASSQTITVNAATADNTATTADGDYTGVPSTLLTFPANTTTPQHFHVQVNGDTKFEPTETFFVNLSGPTNATVGAAAQAFGELTNDDLQPTISINDITLSEGNTGTTDFDFIVRLSNPSSQTITMNVETGDASATTADSDYTGVPSTQLVFPPNTTTQHVHVLVNGDTKFEQNEFFQVDLSSPVNATFEFNDGEALGFITNEDAQPTISINDVAVTEGNAGTTMATFTVSLSNASYQGIFINYSTANNTATAGTDYVATGDTLQFGNGETSKTISVTVNGDLLNEVNETFNLNLTSAMNGTFTDNQGVGTINNDDAQPSISVSDVSVSEGNAGTSTANLTVSLSAASGQTVTVNYATADGTAMAGSDYVTAGGTVTFTPGQTSQPVSVTINGDTTLEANETFNVNLSGATNATIADNQGVGTITNDDAQPSISISDVSVNEGDTGTTTAGFIVSLSNASSQTITVNYATTDGSATAGTDYVATSGTLTFAPEQTSQPVSVTVNGDVLNEETSLTFKVDLSTATNATIADNQGVGTIVDNDAPILATEANSQRAIALDAVTFVRDPFAVTNPHYFGADHRSRIILFATNLSPASGLVVTAQAVDSQQTNHNLTVEHVESLPTFLGFTQVVVKLPDGIVNAGDLQVSITVRGRTSNSVLVGVTP